MTESDFQPGLAGFAAQFRAQVEAGAPPASEHAVHFCLALGFQTAYDLPPGAVVFERPCAGRKRIDLWFAPPLDLSVEVKYSKPSSSVRPYTMIYGGFLADLNKVMMAPSAHRMVVLAADSQTFNHMKGKAGRDLLPWVHGKSTRIDPEDIGRLPETAKRSAVEDGPWTPLTARAAWAELVDTTFLIAWEVEPV